MKKVCIDINSIVHFYISGHVSGIGRTTLELIKALSNVKEKIPFEIILYSQNMKGIGGRNFDFPFKSRHVYCPYREKYNQFLGNFPIREFLTGYDLLHIPHNFEYLYKPEKSVITLHDALFMKIQEQIFGHAMMKQIVPLLMHKCKSIITCSEYSKNDIIETMGIHPDKIAVIPWGVRHDVFFPINDKTKVKDQLHEKFQIQNPYFLSVSCNMERKNTPRLIDVYIELAKEGLKNDLCLIWDAPLIMRNKVKNMGMQHKIHFIPNVSDSDLRLFYSGATAMVFPSLYEGFGLPVLESMACGTPVICSDVTSLPEIGGDVPIYINPVENDSIKDALVHFENKEYDVNLMSQKGIKRASTYDWNKCALNTVSIYEKDID